LRRAVARYQDRLMWDQLVEAGMTTDVSWARSANAYDRLFVSLVGGSKDGNSKPSGPPGPS